MRIAILAHVRQRIAHPSPAAWNRIAGTSPPGCRIAGTTSSCSRRRRQRPRFAIDPVLGRHYEATFPWAEHRGSAPLIAHLDAGYAAACDRIAGGGFDVVHNNSLHRFPLERRRRR
ncbi:hypothetical protein AB5I41_07175 [Sphingomonas sp. MMS24-JH45]